MASSAALMQGMDSYDSSLAAGAGGPTMGGITLGSVAPSFHSEDESEDGQHWARKREREATKGKQREWEEQSSIMDEQEVTTEEQSSYHPPQQQQQPARPRPPSSSSTATSYNNKHAPPSPRRPIPSSLVDLGAHGQSSRLDDSDDHPSSVGLLKELNVDDSVYSAQSPRPIGGALARLNGQAAKKKSAAGGVGQNMTLREQEKVIDEFKKENFDLKLKIHFYQQRMEQLAPEHVVALTQENIDLKMEFNNMRSELKKHRKLLQQAQGALDGFNAERELNARVGAAGGSKGGGKRERELEKELLRYRDQAGRDREELEALERKVRELKEAGRAGKSRTSRGGEEEWDKEDARAEISHLRHELACTRDSHEEALGTAEDLRHELREMRDLLDEVQDDLVTEREGREREGRGDESSVVERSGRTGGGGEGGEVGRLQEDISSLRLQLAAQLTLLTTREEEKRELEGEVEELRRGWRESRGGDGEGRSREQLEEELNHHRDLASSHALQVEALEQQLQEKEQEIEELLGDLEQREVDGKNLLEAKESDIDELADKVEQLMQELQTKEAEMKADLKEVDDLTHDLQKLGAQIFNLEEEADQKDDRIRELETELDAVDTELEDKQTMHEQVVVALKEKLSSTKSRLGDLNIQHESSLTENKFLRDKVEELSLRTAELEEKTKADVEVKRRLEDEAVEIMRALRKEEEERDLDRQEWNRQRRDEEHKHQRSLEAQSKDATQAQAEVAHLKSLLSIREGDLQSLQDALNGLEASSRRLGEEKNNDRFALELELDRLKRDFARCEQDLERTRKEMEVRAAELRERDMDLAALHSENKDLATQLAAQTQTRLGLTDKYDSAAKTLRDTQDELSMARDRLRVVEDELSTGHRALSRTETQYRDQLTERNTLLLTIYQYMDKIIASPPRKPGQPELEPFKSSFKAFHDSLITRLRSVSQIQHSFERRTKEIEAVFSNKFTALKSQHESRLKQLDRFEDTIKKAVDNQRLWRQRVHDQQKEVDAAKTLNHDLQAQLAALRRNSPNGSPEVGSLTSRAKTAERRLAATQAQLQDAESKLADARNKVAVAQESWEARLKEMAKRLHEAEEKVKRERQGAKERVHELGDTIKALEGQVSGARRRDQQLGEVISETERARRAAASRP